MSHRLFIGIRPPALVREALIDTMEALEGARWQDDEQ
jgi:2'-5' RNA ligase